jgi:two-component system, NtrC family, response regulator HydG
MKPISLFIVDDEDVIIKLFERIARQEKLSCASCKNGNEAFEFLAKNEAECVVLDINLPSHSGFQVLEFIRSTKSLAEVVIITGSGSVEQAVKALKLGAFDYLTKPFEDLDKVTSTLKHALEKHRLVKKINELEQPAQPLDSFEGIIGRSPPMQEIYALINSLRASSASVLIEGESGTGKEMIARAIHRTSKRSKKPFLVINCAAIPEGLLESELFGHVKGSFTGALYDKRGLFEEANGGTIFLDEIGEISPAFQVKLLRVLQDGEYKKVGSSEVGHTDVRVIAATNKELKLMVQAGTFREDLYYRLHVIGIHLAPLRDRKEDIPLLAYHFLNKYNEKMKRNVREISLDAMQVLQSYAWIGNVRELENVIERCLVLSSGDVIRAKDMPTQILSKTFYLGAQEENDLSRFNYRDAKLRALDLFNKSYITHLLKDTKGNISLASNRAGMDRSNFKKIIKRYDINIHEYRRG